MALTAHSVAGRRSLSGSPTRQRASQPSLHAKQACGLLTWGLVSRQVCVGRRAGALLDAPRVRRMGGWGNAECTRRDEPGGGERAWPRCLGQAACRAMAPLTRRAGVWCGGVASGSIKFDGRGLRARADCPHSAPLTASRTTPLRPPLGGARRRVRRRGRRRLSGASVCPGGWCRDHRRGALLVGRRPRSSGRRVPECAAAPLPGSCAARSALNAQFSNPRQRQSPIWAFTPPRR